MNKKIIFITILGVLLFLATPVFAQNLVVEFENDPLFDEANFLPGQSITRWVRVTNNSGESQRIATEAINVNDTNRLGDVLNLKIKQGSSILYNDALSKFFIVGEEYLSDLANGATTQYDFIMTFYSGTQNSFQGKTLGFDIIVGFQGTEGGLLPGAGGGGGGGSGGGTPLPPGLSIYSESVEITVIEEISVTIIWTTSYSATSQVIYAAEGENHTLDLTDSSGAPPKYGYAHTTSEYDVNPKVKNHSVTITGLTPGMKYYFRVVSHSSLALSQEYSFATLISEEGEITAEAIEVEEEAEEGIGGEVFPEGAREGEVAGEVIEEGETPEGEEEEIIILSEEEEAQPSLLAAIVNIVSFGTDKTWIAIVIAIIVLAILAYLVYYFSRKAYRKKLEKFKKPE